MKLVMRSNKQIQIAPERLGDFQERGFLEVDEKTGQPLTTPQEAEEKGLKKELAALKKENKALTEQVGVLTAQLAAPPAVPPA